MRFRSTRFALLAFGLLSMMSAKPSKAAPTVYFDRDDSTLLMTSFPNSQAKFNHFTSALGSFGVDNVDTAAGFNPSLSFGGTSITAATQGVLAQAAPTYVIGTQALLEQDVVGFPQVNTKFTFNQYVTAFGTFVIQGGDTAANNNLTTVRLRNTATKAFVDVPIQVGPDWAENNVFFFGVTETVPFNEVEIFEAVETPGASGGATDGMLYDNIVAGFNIPEPTSALLLMVGGALPLGRRTRFHHC